MTGDATKWQLPAKLAAEGRAVVLAPQVGD
jgi:hypothetical protein